jgi:hypothetical protein
VAIAGYGRTQIRYEMFDLERSADEAKRLTKCQNIYHRGQELAWDGRDVLAEQLAKHGGIHLADDKRKALERIFNIILWGELAAWKISAQLADGLEPLEAKMAATSQAHDEARHFYVMHDYLTALGYTPRRMDRAPQAVLDLVLETRDLATKLLGMQLLVETLALTVFQSVRELDVEPVLTELMRYYERDEARHVGLGMQYLPSLLARMPRRKIMRLITFQVHIMGWALAELRVLRPDFEVLGIDPRMILERARRKQLAAITAAYAALGIPLDRHRNLPVMALNAVVELAFPIDPRTGVAARAAAAWRAFWQETAPVGADELRVHAAHEIRTARGKIAGGDEIG